MPNTAEELIAPVATRPARTIPRALDAYYGGNLGTIGRALFSTAGPLLSASVAMLLFNSGGAETV